MDMHSSLDDATAVDVQVMGVWRLAKKWVGKKMRSLVTACAQLFLPLHVFATMYSTSGGHQSREDPLDDRDAGLRKGSRAFSRICPLFFGVLRFYSPTPGSLVYRRKRLAWEVFGERIIPAGESVVHWVREGEGCDGIFYITQQGRVVGQARLPPGIFSADKSISLDSRLDMFEYGLLPIYTGNDSGNEVSVSLD